MKSSVLNGALRSGANVAPAQFSRGKPGAVKAAAIEEKLRPGADPDLQELIRIRAYERAERAGRAADAEREDWLEAEADVRRRFVVGAASAAKGSG